MNYDHRCQNTHGPMSIGAPSPPLNAVGYQWATSGLFEEGPINL